MADDEPDTQSLIVIFDDAATSVDRIREGLQKAGYPAEGDPVFLKK